MHSCGCGGEEVGLSNMENKWKAPVQVQARGLVQLSLDQKDDSNQEVVLDKLATYGDYQWDNNHDYEDTVQLQVQD